MSNLDIYFILTNVLILKLGYSNKNASLRLLDKNTPETQL